MESYKEPELKRLGKLYGIPWNTLKSRQQQHGRLAMEAKIIEKICNDRFITLEMFLNPHQIAI